MSGRDVFLSHASADRDAALALRAALEGAGHSCWMAPYDIVGSRPWAEQIVEAIRATNLVIVLLSSSSLASEHVATEVALARSRKVGILPIRIEEVQPDGDLAYHLAQLQRIDAFPPPLDAHLPGVLRMVGLQLERTRPSPPPVVDELRPGDVVGDFTVTGLLGEGGMARVFRARQAGIGRDVALKVIRADRAADPEYRTRFLEESSVLARLEHPSIVPVYAAGEARGVLHIAMRLLDGSTLEQRIGAGPLDLAETVALLRPIADAVDHAHRAGIVHRDLKPSNIILDRDGHPYVTDFGLGKRFGAASAISRPGIAIGTLGYMAPEQALGRVEPGLAPRLDVYALACVAFACLTGSPPHRIDSPEALAVALSGPVPSIRALRPELPASVEAAFAAALARDPAGRTASARAFVGALESVRPAVAPTAVTASDPTVVPVAPPPAPVAPSPFAAAPPPPPSTSAAVPPPPRPPEPAGTVATADAAAPPAPTPPPPPADPRGPTRSGPPFLRTRAGGIRWVPAAAAVAITVAVLGSRFLLAGGDPTGSPAASASGIALASPTPTGTTADPIASSTVPPPTPFASPSASPSPSPFASPSASPSPSPSPARTPTPKPPTPPGTPRPSVRPTPAITPPPLPSPTPAPSQAGNQAPGISSYCASGYGMTLNTYYYDVDGYWFYWAYVPAWCFTEPEGDLITGFYGGPSGAIKFAFDSLKTYDGWDYWYFRYYPPGPSPCYDDAFTFRVEDPQGLSSPDLTIDLRVNCSS